MGIEEIKKAKEEAKKTITRPSQKVAALLIALGPATASEILKNIKDEDLLEQITLDIANLGKISDEDLNDVLNEFKTVFQARNYIAQGGISYAKQLAEKFDAKIVTGEKNNEFLSNPTLNLTEKHRLSLKPFSADILLKDGDNFMLGNTEIKYITTPGHTSGCGSYIFDDTIISGDTLFCESYGRTDFPTGDDAEMAKSIRKLKNLEGDYRVIPGHGPTTTLDHERKYNPLMRIL